MACGAGVLGLCGCGAAERAQGGSCRATRPAASRLNRLRSYHRGGGRLTSSAPYLTPKGGGTPSQPGSSAPAVRLPLKARTSAVGAFSCAVLGRERRASSGARGARSGGRFTCVTACRGTCSGLARAVELSTAHNPPLEPICAGEVAPSVHKEAGEWCHERASHVRVGARACPDSERFGPCESHNRPSDC